MNRGEIIIISRDQYFSPEQDSNLGLQPSTCVNIVDNLNGFAAMAGYSHNLIGVELTITTEPYVKRHKGQMLKNHKV